MRYFLDISYKGTSYHGWQFQKNAHTLQAEIENAISRLLGVQTPIMASGRTDAGVHAKQQIAHFDTVESIDVEKLEFRLNRFFTRDITINSIVEVKPDAHARFNANERAYEYYINQKKNPFLQELSYYFPNPLKVELMNEAASKLLGTQDFESFSKVKTEVNNFICNITKARWQIENDSLVFHVTANRFLRGMVRALVGTLLEVGLGKLTVEDFIKIIEHKDRTAAGRAVPPKGLFLSKVTYPSSVYSN
ncbi:tRNA pseudouridine(38-40) synthase TruA [Roseivirga echinicomitans]|uniref:tRNA pseudouridine synthase A n=1 Tax=Roseivirga echinicomitans TaxID=296218 RepID=A0A150XD64_9BACT|nr:tRNA pseudouridine(38-40) synthase TruA [Roseivirga echinicomitans]KYG76679.1 pseudouridine synthase [Roseivirga echinicomitans]